MGTIRVQQVGKAFGIETLFQNVSFEVRRGDKIGIIGANGAGKTTLFRCLLGTEQHDEGQISWPPGETVGHVEQQGDFGAVTLYEELRQAYEDVLACGEEMRRLEKELADEKEPEELERKMAAYARATEHFERGGGYEVDATIRKVAFGLGFTEEDFGREAAAFSGGQKTRILLARALLRQPDFLFLDEPTNHLDIAMTKWLEEFLRGYAGGMLIISHDRYFLDRVATRILELESGTVTAYEGNYSRYLEQKALRMESLQRAYEKQQTVIAQTEEFIRRYKAGIKSKQARGRETRLARMERIVLPASQARFDHFAFSPPAECAERVLECKNMATAYGSRTIFEKLSLLIRRGDGVALVGPNGAGKTTLLKLVLGELTPLRGEIKLGNRVKVGYFAQEHETLYGPHRLLDEIMSEYHLSEERSRGYLGAFLFRGDDVYKRIDDLSGGEKARLAFLKLMLSGANFLVLDEPTNHLDIPAREAVEEAIMAFPGTFLVVSHDRYFLDKVANCILELEDGVLREYVGNYSYYQEQKEAAQQLLADTAAEPDAKERTPQKPAAIAAPKEEPMPVAMSASRRKGDAERKLPKLEERIAELEMLLKWNEQQLYLPENLEQPEEMQRLAEEREKLAAQLDDVYAQWLELQEE